MITQAQKDYADTLAKKNGFRNWSDAEKARTGKVKIGFGKSEMSSLIDWLKGGAK